jgi:acetate kinase
LNILIINAGSSSIKYQLIDMRTEEVIAKGIAERVGINDSVLKHKPTGKEPVVIKQDMETHEQAIKLVLECLVHPDHGVIKDMKEINAVGHRAVHGGEQFSSSVIIDENVMKAIEDCIALAPLHNPPNILGIRACQKAMPNVPMVAVFDTAFHQTMPKYAFLYGLPYEDYTELKIRRYGFHGTSHYYISRRLAEVIGKPVESLKIITCHLGNGSSVAAVMNGKSVDTSMGLTPLEGLIMGTRCGDIDPGVIKVLMDKRHLDSQQMNDYLNKKCGVLGLSHMSSDFRDLEAAANAGDAHAALVRETFCYRLKKYVGAYAAVMNGVDAIAFAGGIGENDPDIRAESLQGMEYLGIKIDVKANEPRGKEIRISTPDSRVEVWTIPTNEELTIARETMALVK